jgi:hypothetical protein
VEFCNPFFKAFKHGSGNGISVNNVTINAEMLRTIAEGIYPAIEVR